MVAGGHRIIAEDALNLVELLSLSTPTRGHTLVRYTSTDNRTTSTVVDRNRYNHRTESVGSTKESTNFLIYTACCCSASNLTFHAYIPPYSTSRCMRISKYFKKLQKQPSKPLLTKLVLQLFIRIIRTLFSYHPVSVSCKIFNFLKSIYLTTYTCRFWFAYNIVTHDTRIRAQRIDSKKKI